MLFSFDFAFELENFSASIINLLNTLDFWHVGDVDAELEVEVAQSVQSSSLTLVENHFVFVQAGIGRHQEHDVSRS